MGFWVVATQIFFMFHPYLGKDGEFETYFSDGLVQPPTRFDIFVYSWLIFVQEKCWVLVFRLDRLECIGYTFPVLGAAILTRRCGQPQSNHWHLLYSRTVVCQFCHYWGEPGFQTHGRKWIALAGDFSWEKQCRKVQTGAGTGRTPPKSGEIEPIASRHNCFC